MTRPHVEHRNTRSATKARDALRRRVAEDRAQAFVDRLAEDLHGLDAETVLEVCRAIVRKIAGVMAVGINATRSVGVLSGAISHVSPAYEPQAREARQTAETVFRKAVA